MEGFFLLFVKIAGCVTILHRKILLFRKKLLAGLPPVDGITNKTVAAVVKLMCSKGETVYAYTFDKEPLLFETEEQILFPTG